MSVWNRRGRNLQQRRRRRTKEHEKKRERKKGSVIGLVGSGSPGKSWLSSNHPYYRT